MEILDLTPPQLEWRIYKGDTSTFNVIVGDDSGNPIDLSDYSFEAILKNNEMVEIVSLDIYVDANVVTIGIPVGIDLSPRNYFDLQGTKLDTVTTFLRGTIFTEGDIS